MFATTHLIDNNVFIYVEVSSLTVEFITMQTSNLESDFCLYIYIYIYVCVCVCVCVSIKFYVKKYSCDHIQVVSKINK